MASVVTDLLLAESVHCMPWCSHCVETRLICLASCSVHAVTLTPVQYPCPAVQ